MVELKIQNGNKIHFSPHQIMFHSTRTYRNFILVKTLAPRSVKLYESAAIRELVSLKACPLALDDWTAISEKLVGL